MYSKPKCSSLDELDILIDQVGNKAGKEFDNLVSTFSINREQNKQWASDYYRLVKETKKLAKSIRCLKVWKWILIIFLIFPFFLMNNAQKKKQVLLDQKNKELSKAQENLEKQLTKFRENLSYQIAYDKIISQVWPDVKIDLSMDSKSAANWEHDFGQYMPIDSCATSLVSGTIFDHPFVLMNKKHQTWHPHVYTGSIPVTYTDYVDGKTVTRTQIVVATVTLPEPGWSHLPYFYYRASKPYELSFCNNLSAKTLKKQNKKGVKQAMENKEFDKLFAADRNNEIQYRVVFTPLAQEGMVNLLKKKQYNILKEKELTTITTQCDLVDNDFSDDVNYDLTEWKNQYVDWVQRLVWHIGLLSLPIANMPVLYQIDYVKHNKDIASRLQAQANVGWIFNMYDMYHCFETDVIFECDSYNKTTVDKNPLISSKVKCNSFHLNHRTEMVPRPSARGTVLVPVHVIDYLPRSRTLYVYQHYSKNYNKEILGDGWAMHSGQLLIWSWSAMNPESIKRIISKTK